jgi:hypothetical protein
MEVKHIVVQLLTCYTIKKASDHLISSTNICVCRKVYQLLGNKIVCCEYFVTIIEHRLLTYGPVMYFKISKQRNHYEY